MAKKLKRAYSPSEIEGLKKKRLEFTGEWERVFGHPEMQGVWFVWGASGNGKTSFVMQLCKELARFGKVVYDSLEEGVSQSMVNTIKRHGMTDVNRRFVILDGEKIESLEERMKRPRSAQFWIIDSFQYTGFNASQYLDFVERHPKKLIVFVSQADGNKPKGRTAEGAMYDASQKIHIKGFRAYNNGRSGEVGDYYTIYAGGARKYWGGQGDEIKNGELNESNN